MSNPVFEQYVNEFGNTSVRVSQDVVVLTCDDADRVQAKFDQLNAENAKLHNLCAEVASILFNLDVDRCGLCQRDDISHPCPAHTVKGGECSIKSELRELRIEVDR